MENKKRLIDVNKVINFMQKCLDESQDKYSIAHFAFQSIIECLKQEPSVDAVEVVHGHWIAEHEESIRCSECCFNRANIKIPMDYCPNCGAKMDGGVEHG